MTKPRAVDYASHQEPVPASATAMFFLFLPAALVAIYAMATRMLIAIMTAGSHTDVHAFGLMVPFIFLVPLAGICLIFMFIDLLAKRKGWIAALQGLAWNILLIAVCAIIIHVLPQCAV